MAKKSKDEKSRSALAAQIRADQARKDRMRNIIAGVAVLAIVSGLIAAAVIFSPDPKSSKVTVNKINAPVAATEHGLRLGKESAPHQVIVYEDFQCPYCREFENASRSFFHEAAESGKLTVEYRPLNLPGLDPYSIDALNTWLAVVKHGTGKQALQMHDILFEKQPYETATDKPTAKDMQGWAKSIGVGSAALAAMKDPDAALVKAANDTANQAGVEGTPTVLLNGTKLQGTPQQMFEQIQQAVNAS
ncbi:MAG TPA: thioredoxin domain-containing protein [Marmoricola sp.]|nr:thioredoxin domain-containing protein [Marmoricola sp.]